MCVNEWADAAAVGSALGLFFSSYYPSYVAAEAK